MSTNIIEFAREGSGVRVIEIDEEPWFVAADVCNYFGVTNRNRALQRLEDDEKGGTQLSTRGGMQNVTIINESGLYSLLFALQPQKARGVTQEQVEERTRQIESFRRWVTSEVLPTIRKTGAYGVPQLTGPALMAAALQEADRTMKELEARASKSETQLDMIEGTSGSSIRQFHKHYFPDVPERVFFELLYKKRLLIDQRGTRGRDKQGKLKNGYEHKHPAAAGKAFFGSSPPTRGARCLDLEVCVNDRIIPAYAGSTHQGEQ